ncbi:hypothetical protein R1sor_009320 [Riccia sorocarpa]|uniref:Bromodomain associated domain-containing protein n=1 Tax=Riccia sorocarpa TaxID=122646 RepID=A0ABD3HWU0_9MARC
MPVKVLVLRPPTAGAKLAVGHVANGQHRDVAMSGSGDEFGHAVAKIGVAQLCEAVGFNAMQRSAGETLADILIRYLTDLAKAAHFYANLAGRTQYNTNGEAILVLALVQCRLITSLVLSSILIMYEQANFFFPCFLV